MERGLEDRESDRPAAPSPIVEIEIETNAGNRWPPGENGDNMPARPRKVTPGYWKDPGETAAAFLRRFGSRSGDVGYLDGDGFFYLSPTARRT